MAPPFIKRYLIALDRHKWAGLAGFIVVMGLSSVAALQPPPPASYTAQGLLTYSTPPITLSTTSTALQQQGQALTPESLLSSYVLETVSSQLAEQQINASPSRLRQNATVSFPDSERNNRNRQQATGLQVVVSYQDTDSQRAELISNLLLNAMVEQSRLFNTQQLNRIRENLDELLPKVTQDLRQAERALEQYIRREGPALQAAEDGALVGSITGSQQQQRQLQLTLSGIEAQIQSLQARLGLSADQAYASSALSADPIIADLRAQLYRNETQMMLLSQTLRPQHPSMVELQNQQSTYEQLLQQRVSEVIGGNQVVAPLAGSMSIRQNSSLDPARQTLANTLVNLQTQRDTLRQQVVDLARSEQELRQEYASIPDKQLEQSRLQQQVALRRTFYDQLQGRLADVTLAQEETVGSLVIAQPPQVQLVAEPATSGMVILLVGGMVGLLVGGGLVLLLDSLDATFQTLPDLQTALRQQEVPVLGLLPLMPVQDLDGLPVVMDAGSPYSEPFERFRGNLRRAGSGKALKMILLTSAILGEGKSTTAYNLAIASARAGKRTLLIEADLRSPSHAGTLKVAPDPDSVVDPLRYYGHLSENIRLVPEVENLYILPSPGAQRQAAAILESSEMRRLLEDVRNRFDLVILDTPALSRYNDALLLEPYTDGMLMVTRPGYTEEGLLTEAVDQFTEAEDIQFLGAVINGADIPIQLELEDDLSHFVVEDLEGQQDLERVGN